MNLSGLSGTKGPEGKPPKHASLILADLKTTRQLWWGGISKNLRNFLCLSFALLKAETKIQHIPPSEVLVRIIHLCIALKVLTRCISRANTNRPEPTFVALETSPGTAPVNLLCCNCHEWKPQKIARVYSVAVGKDVSVLPTVANCTSLAPT